MPMKAILLPLEESDGVPSMLETACLAAQRFGSHIDGLYVRRALPGVVVADIGGYAAATPDLMQSFEEEDRQRGERMRTSFEEFMRKKGVPLGAPGDGGPSAAWTVDNPPGDAALGMLARTFDLTVVGRPVGGAGAPAMSTLESVLFDSGRPVLIAPPVPTKTLAEVVVISWNGSTETARAVALAMPFLVTARRTVVLAVEGVMVPGPRADEVARNLERNGIPAKTREIPAGGRGGGEVILSEAGALGADLLIKGAYTHSRLRQMIFGGATSHILDQAQIPVLMAH